ncbi:DNA cytosine methyltransferase [Streptomyces sp. 351MFTsu5.1]|uniref:DNA cytosine methyltransferase n=1 Tax=Streptomyces sp. 351MFTsu5.1 TaxID=1172180 RepID=UPI0003666DE7|nr:DNA cytosine methyltransferase [Streptomyces sp. 351MFTsu5.1]
MSALRIGSLFTGTGALDLAVMDVYDAEVIWHSQYEPPDKKGREDKNQYAAKILARHWPTVPNLGDITKVDWQAVLDEHGPIDILTGGFPCQDVSSAGRRVGLAPDSRSGLWTHMARAVAILQPRLVIIENVEGLLSAPAASDMEPCAYCVGDGRSEPLLRACGAVLGDLASLGLDAEWGRFGADEVGAPHRRRRIIIRAWPAHADTANLGHERFGIARGRGNGPADRDLAAADTAGHKGWVGDRNDVRVGCGADGREPAAGRSEALADTSSLIPGDDRELPAGRDAVQRGVRDDAPRCGSTATDANDERSGEERQGAHLIHGQRQAQRRRTVQQPRTDGDREAGDGGAAGEPTGGRQTAARQQADRRTVLDLRDGDPDLDWGDYEPAIRRWERVLGRPAPWPTDLLGRLSPVFTEWLMGLPDGWVTDTPGLTRAAMLRALGNGVVRQQAAAALRELHQRAAGDEATAA